MADGPEGGPPAAASSTDLPAERAQRPPPAYLLSLTVENVRCFGPKQTLRLHDAEGRPAPWTVLLGENGVGKTTLLECLARLQPEPFADPGATGRGVPRMMHPAYGAAQWESYIRRGARERSARRDLREPPEAAFIGCELLYGARLSDRTGGQVTDELYSAALATDSGVSAQHHTVDYARLRGLVCYGYGAARHVGRPSLTENGADRSASLLAEQAPLPDPEEWLLQADYGAIVAARDDQGAAQHRERYHQRVVEALRKVLPKDVREIRVKDFSTSDNPPDLGIEVATQYGRVRLHELSLGHRTMVAWLVDLARRLVQRYPDSSDPLAEPAVVLLDEIDLHIHPKWQRQLRQLLTAVFRETQFIVTAHSPLVVQAAGDANVAVLRPEGDCVTIHQDLPSIEGWRVDQILTSGLFDLPSARPPHLDALLAERRRILSQGRLSETDQQRLAELSREIGRLPGGERPEDIEAMDIIRRAAAELRRQGEGRHDPHP